MNFSRFPQLFSLLAASSLFAQANAEVVRIPNGGEILKSLIERCDIVGISSSNAGARYALRTIRPGDIESSEFDSVVINIQTANKSAGRPQRLALFLNEVERDSSGEIQRYFIKGTFDNNPASNGAAPLFGTLSQIAFSPSDTMKVSLNNVYNFRGTLTKIQQFDDSVTKIFTTVSGWDLAIPSSFNKQAICAGRESSNQDAIFVR